MTQRAARPKAKRSAKNVLKREQNKQHENLLDFHLKAYGLGQYFTREFMMKETGRKFLWDFADPINKVAIEVQGGIWMPKGAHNTGLAILRDHEKSNAAQFHDWRVFYCTPQTIKSCAIIDLIAAYYWDKLNIRAKSFKV
jgi:hypothetical protein